VPRYRERGHAFVAPGHGVLYEKGWVVFGEGTPYYEASPKGCFSVDLGYNVEETLPSLALYGLLNKDEEVLASVTQSLQTHLELCYRMAVGITAGGREL